MGTQEVSPQTRFERFGEVKTYHDLGMEQGNFLVPLSTLVALGWRVLPGDSEVAGPRGAHARSH